MGFLNVLLLFKVEIIFWVMFFCFWEWYIIIEWYWVLILFFCLLGVVGLWVVKNIFKIWFSDIFLVLKEILIILVWLVFLEYIDL